MSLVSTSAHNTYLSSIEYSSTIDVEATGLTYGRAYTLVLQRHSFIYIDQLNAQGAELRLVSCFVYGVGLSFQKGI